MNAQTTHASRPPEARTTDPLFLGPATGRRAGRGRAEVSAPTELLTPQGSIFSRRQHYYWPIFASDRLIPQSDAEGAGNQNQPVAFRSVGCSVTILPATA